MSDSILKTSPPSHSVAQAKRSRGHVRVGSCDRNHPSSSDPLWGSKQNSIKTFIGCMIGLVSGPQALPAPSVCMFGNPQYGKKKELNWHVKSWLSQVVVLFGVLDFAFRSLASLAFSAFNCGKHLVQFCTSCWRKRRKKSSRRLHSTPAGSVLFHQEAFLFSDSLQSLGNDLFLFFNWSYCFPWNIK